MSSLRIFAFLSFFPPFFLLLLLGTKLVRGLPKSAPVPVLVIPVLNGIVEREAPGGATDPVIVRAPYAPLPP